MTNNEILMVGNETLVAIYDNTLYIWSNNSWIEVLNTGEDR